MPKLDSIEIAHPEIVRAPLNEGLLGTSPAITEVKALILQLAKSDLTVLIGGESGTGKDIAARMLHKNSSRYGKPFIKVNCPAIPESILESELFGYERGAFTGARTSKPGRFELANNGTIFLDEIAETSLAVQGKLLQVIDGEPFLRIGGVTPIHISVRVIAATNVPLDESVRSGRMREDIFFRLSEVIVQMPPLRDRVEDVPLLAEHFNYNYSQRLSKEYEALPPDFVAEMMDLPWPGNVRELGACVKKYVTTGDPETLLGDSPVDAPDDVSGGDSAHGSPARHEKAQDSSAQRFPALKVAVQRAVEETEKSLIEDALKYTLWNRRKAAKLLRISYSSLLRRIDAYQIGKEHES